MQGRLPDKKNDNNILFRYAGMGAQILVSLGLAVFIGLKLDAWIRTPFPVLVWVLPLLVIAVTIVRLVKETARDRNGKKRPPESDLIYYPC